MSEPPDLRAEAARWLREASEELRAARAVQRDPDSPGRIACFLAHVAAEKALKGMLVAQGVPVRRTHDLRELYELLAPEGRRKLVSDELRTLNPWAIGGRYTDELADADEATVAEALEIAARVFFRRRGGASLVADTNNERVGKALALLAKGLAPFVDQRLSERLGDGRGLGDTVRELAYCLYTTSERKGWPQEALP